MRLKMRKNKEILYFVFYIGFYLLLYLCFVLCAKIDFIPLFNNVFLGLAVLMFFVYQIYFISKFTNLNINFYLKLLLTLLMIGLGFLAGYFVLIMSIFAFKDSESFVYNGEKYYILNEGWLDDEFVVYKKEFIAMDEMTYENSKKTFRNLEMIANKDAKECLKFYLNKYKEINNEKVTEEFDAQKEIQNESEILNNFDFEDARKIPNSSYGLVEVDRAGARSRWFFVEIINNEFNLISELPDTSPDISGEIVDDGSILLICKDINGNLKKYRSVDAGKTFVPFN